VVGHIHAWGKLSEPCRACSAGRVEAVKFLVGEAKAGLEAKDRSGATPLFVAASTAEKDIALYLISQGADVEVGRLSCA
jgi:ankyrin repeat protein